MKKLIVAILASMALSAVAFAEDAKTEEHAAPAADAAHHDEHHDKADAKKSKKKMKKESKKMEEHKEEATH